MTATDLRMDYSMNKNQKHLSDLKIMSRNLELAHAALSILEGIPERIPRDCVIRLRKFRNSMSAKADKAAAALSTTTK